MELFEWLQDMNWPGAFVILERLQKYEDVPSYNSAFDICIRYAQASEDDIWESNLEMVKRK